MRNFKLMRNLKHATHDVSEICQNPLEEFDVPLREA